jgi:hypothetical protein
MSAATVTVPKRMPPRSDPSAAVETQPRSLLDEESRAWLRDLRAEGRTKDEEVARLHALLLRAARFECAPSRRSPMS